MEFSAGERKGYRSSWVLTVVRSGPGTNQIWGMIEEANMPIELVPLAAYMNYNQMSESKQFYSVRLLVFVYPSLYKALKLTFPGDIGGLSLD